MSQHDYNIANQTFPATRADLNNALGAIATKNSGATGPSTTYAYQWWYDTANDILKIRNADNDAWINFVSFDQTTDTWSIDSNINTADLIPDADSTRDLGSASAAWALAYLDAIEPVGTDTTIKRVGGTNTTPIVEGIAKVWANINGTGTIAARDSFNVASLTDNGTGDYTVNFSNAFGAADYSSLFAATTYSGSVTTHIAGSISSPPATGSIRLISLAFASPFANTDVTGVNVSINGDLA